VFLMTPFKRSCRHFIHQTCGEYLVLNDLMNCPYCKIPFVSIATVPSIETDPQTWFRMVDFDGNGQLSKLEVLECLKTFLPTVDVTKVEANIDKFWSMWDKDKSGELSYLELCDPKTGLVQSVKSKFVKTEEDKPPPKMSLKNLKIWFEYWDEDGSKSLDKEEIVRALIKTFCVTQDVSKVNEMRQIVEAVWGAFDFDGSGSITLDEFITPRDGLGESLVASFAFTNPSSS